MKKRIDVQVTDLASFHSFIEDYKIHPLPSDKPPTLLEIAGFPHWENVYSNILAFLMDTKKVHGFGSLFIRSIMAAYDASRPDDAPLSVDKIERTDRVEREVTTRNRKRIDIVIECPDVVICIENKILSGVSNDLAEYRRHCGKIRRTVIGIVLSPTPVSHDDEAKLMENRFVNVMYRDFVTEVRKRMGSYIGPHNTPYQYLLFDFLEQADRLKRSMMTTDEQERFLEFWRENEEKIRNIQDHCDRLRELAEEAAADHYDQCMEELTDKEKRVFERYRKGSMSEFYLADDGYLDGCRITLDVYFDPLRIQHWLGKWGGSGLDMLAGEIQRTSDIEIKRDPSSGQYKIVDGGDWSPYCDSGRKHAVETSVKILKAIAAMHLAREQLS